MLKILANSDRTTCTNAFLNNSNGCYRNLCYTTSTLSVHLMMWLLHDAVNGKSQKDYILTAFFLCLILAPPKLTIMDTNKGIKDNGCMKKLAVSPFFQVYMLVCCCIIGTSN